MYIKPVLFVYTLTAEIGEVFFVRLTNSRMDLLCSQRKLDKLSQIQPNIPPSLAANLNLFFWRPVFDLVL
jgi:hypothetical protein